MVKFISKGASDMATVTDNKLFLKETIDVLSHDEINTLAQFVKTFISSPVIEVADDLTEAER